jgi:hypothetical protein
VSDGETLSNPLVRGSSPFGRAANQDNSAANSAESPSKASTVSNPSTVTGTAEGHGGEPCRVINLQAHRAVRRLRERHPDMPFEPGAPRGGRQPVVVQNEGERIALLVPSRNVLLTPEQAGELAGDLLRLLDARAQLSAMRAFQGFDPEPHDLGCPCDRCEGCVP